MTAARTSRTDDLLNTRAGIRVLIGPGPTTAARQASTHVSRRREATGRSAPECAEQSCRAQQAAVQSCQCVQTRFARQSQSRSPRSARAPGRGSRAPRELSSAAEPTFCSFAAYCRKPMKWKLGPTSGAVAIFAVLVATAAAQGPGDWPQWRGPGRDGVVAAFAAPASWPERLTRKWKVEVGLGYATPVLVGDRALHVLAAGRRRGARGARCGQRQPHLDVQYAAPFTISPAAARHEKGPKSTPTFADGRIFTLGMTNVVTAVDAATGSRSGRSRRRRRSRSITPGCRRSSTAG